MHPDPDPIITGYASRFGGLWPDREDAADQLDARLADRRLDEADAALFRDWMRDGFVVLEGAVDEAALDSLQQGVEDIWAGRHPRAHVEYWKDGVQHIEPVKPEHRALQAKLLDAHGASPLVRDALFCPRGVRFLRQLFEREPLAFQTLYFQRGTEQPMHQDTAYVLVDAPLELVGSWLALEDIREGTGELEYYVGSHRLGDYPWGGDTKGMPPGHPEHERYLEALHEHSAAKGLERRVFRPKRGDLLLWHADLAHGGSSIAQPDASRLSIVTHYCPVDRAPGYFRHHAHSERLRHGSGVHWCYPCRWEPEPPFERGPGDEGSAP